MFSTWISGSFSLVNNVIHSISNAITDTASESRSFSSVVHDIFNSADWLSCPLAGFIYSTESQIYESLALPVPERAMAVELQTTRAQLSLYDASKIYDPYVNRDLFQRVTLNNGEQPKNIESMIVANVSTSLDPDAPDSIIRDDDLDEDAFLVVNSAISHINDNPDETHPTQIVTVYNPDFDGLEHIDDSYSLVFDEDEIHPTGGVPGISYHKNRGNVARLNRFVPIKCVIVPNDISHILPNGFTFFTGHTHLNRTQIKHLVIDRYYAYRIFNWLDLNYSKISTITNLIITLHSHAIYGDPNNERLILINLLKVWSEMRQIPINFQYEGDFTNIVWKYSQDEMLIL